MNFGSLSKQQLEQNLCDLRRQMPAGKLPDELDATLQELHAHQIELEMQNRALRETQAELQHTIRRYADLYDHLPLAYVTVTSQGVITGANAAACEWLRHECAQLVGRPLMQFMGAYDAGRFSAHLDACLRSGQPTNTELVMRLSETESVAVQLSSRVAPHREGEPMEVHIAITDISRLKHAQKILEEVNREQEAFNYSISHDLRAPLVTITNYAGIVLSDHGAQLDDAVKGMVERMRCAAQRMEETLKHLLEYSTLAREEIVVGPVDTDQVVRELLVEYRGVIEGRKGEVTVERPLPRVRAAAVILNQVLANLLTNALKYTNPGESPRVRISGEVHEAHVLLKVADQGIGIDPQFHERIFKVFERLHGYSRYPGSGVGLAIVRRAMERLNGRVWVESNPGQGSCFILQLPKA